MATELNVMIATVAIGGWYPRGVARMIQEFDRVSNGFRILSWVNTLPPDAPWGIVRNGVDYTGYCAKPFALRGTYVAGADIGILLDAAFWPITHIQPLVDHVCSIGYYLCDNGFMVGEWCADHALETLDLTRDDAMRIREASSYCIGIDFRRSLNREWLEDWCAYAADGVTFPGPHTAGNSGRNPGFVSHDPRVRGHRHDQTAASVLAWRYGMHDLTPRPIYTAYDGHQDHRTVLVNRGM